MPVGKTSHVTQSVLGSISKSEHMDSVGSEVHTNVIR